MGSLATHQLYSIKNYVSCECLWIKKHQLYRKKKAHHLFIFFAKPVACQPQYDRIEDTRAGGGVYQASIITKVECLLECVATNSCVGVDWAPQTNQLCWFHMHSISTTRAVTGVVHYILIDRCPGGNLTHILQYKVGQALLKFGDRLMRIYVIICATR